MEPKGKSGTGYLVVTVYSSARQNALRQGHCIEHLILSVDRRRVVICYDILVIYNFRELVLQLLF